MKHKKENSIRFKIVDNVERILENDNKTITEIHTYFLYRRTNGIFQKWKIVYPDWITDTFEDYYPSIEEAIERAKRFVHEIERERVLEKLDKEGKLRETREDILDFKIFID